MRKTFSAWRNSTRRSGSGLTKFRRVIMRSSSGLSLNCRLFKFRRRSPQRLRSRTHLKRVKEHRSSWHFTCLLSTKHWKLHDRLEVGLKRAQRGGDFEVIRYKMRLTPRATFTNSASYSEKCDGRLPRTDRSDF